MADQLDVLTDSEARVAIGLTATDTSQDPLLPQYSNATTLWLDGICREFVVSRELVSCGAAADTNQIPVVGTDAEWAALADAVQEFRTVSIGTDADPWSVAAGRFIVLGGLDRDAKTVTISGPPVTTTGTEAIRSGSFKDTASVASDLKIAAQQHLAWSWRIDRGQAGSFDNVDVPFDTPWRIMSAIPDRLAPGIV